MNDSVETGNKQQNNESNGGRRRKDKERWRSLGIGI
jgi:hypothetical protein